MASSRWHPTEMRHQKDEYQDEDEFIGCRNQLQISQHASVQKGAYGFEVRTKSPVSPARNSEDYDGFPLTTAEQQYIGPAAWATPHQQAWLQAGIQIQPQMVPPPSWSLFNPCVPPPSLLPPPLPPLSGHGIQSDRSAPKPSLHKAGAKFERKKKGDKMGRRHKTAAEVTKRIERCKYYMEGRCNKSDNCTFSHDFQPAKKEELCKYYANSSCRNGDRCVYMHSEWPCKFFHQYHSCKKGSACKFSHDPMTEDQMAKLLRTDLGDELLFYPNDSTKPKYGPSTQTNGLKTGSEKVRDESNSDSNEEYTKEDTDDGETSTITDTNDGAASAIKETDEDKIIIQDFSLNSHQNKAGRITENNNTRKGVSNLGKRLYRPKTPSMESDGPTKKRGRKLR